MPQRDALIAKVLTNLLEGRYASLEVAVERINEIFEAPVERAGWSEFLAADLDFPG